ncbi:MAG TPA: hypothetical protein PLA94_31420 [Myxococcota bacterium]|nr:hypothetical protein [Myxococcota bacterium]
MSPLYLLLTLLSGCAHHPPPENAASLPIETLRAARIPEVYPSGRSQPTWIIEVPRQFVEDIVGVPAMMACIEALQDPRYDGCSFTASPCMTLQLREDGSFRAHVRTQSCGAEAPPLLIIYSSTPSEDAPAWTLPIPGAFDPSRDTPSSPPVVSPP